MSWLKVGPHRVSPWRHWIALWLTLAVVIGAYATYPWTKSQCYEWAVGQRNELQTKLAFEVCNQRFGGLK